MNIILASTSTLHGSNFLTYIQAPIKELFAQTDEIIFIPYARPSGISHDDYTHKVQSFFNTLSIRVRGLHQFENPTEAIAKAQGFFTGGGNTFLLVKTLHDLGLMELLAQTVRNGIPYLGTSAGSNIGGINMQTTNDMPIVYPKSFETMGLVPFNINPHYLDPLPNNTHMGETRETRIKEFHTQNNIPVVGLREGSWIRVYETITLLEGNCTARVFEPGMPPYEIPTNSELKF